MIAAAVVGGIDREEAHMGRMTAASERPGAGAPPILVHITTVPETLLFLAGQVAAMKRRATRSTRSPLPVKRSTGSPVARGFAVTGFG